MCPEHATRRNWTYRSTTVRSKAYLQEHNRVLESYKKTFDRTFHFKSRVIRTNKYKQMVALQDTAGKIIGRLEELGIVQTKASEIKYEVGI